MFRGIKLLKQMIWGMVLKQRGNKYGLGWTNNQTEFLWAKTFGTINSFIKGAVNFD
jgi:hypothetical protein